MERHYKVPKTGKACISKSLSSSSTQTNTCDVEASDEIIIDDDIYIKDRVEYMNPHFEEDENAGDENQIDGDSEDEDMEDEQKGPILNAILRQMKNIMRIS